MSGPGWQPLALMLGGSGVLHLVRPQVYEPLIPPFLGPPRPWVVVSGVAELAVAGALVVPATRVRGGWAAAGLLVAVFPGNVWMAVDWSDRPLPYRVGAYARLPLQVPLVRWAVRVARDASGPRR